MIPRFENEAKLRDLKLLLSNFLCAKLKSKAQYSFKGYSADEIPVSASPVFEKTKSKFCSVKYRKQANSRITAKRYAITYR